MAEPAAHPAPRPRPRRRAPQARSVATRARLLDATVAVLVERGHGGTTTPAVCARAGVSQGALFKHFPTKAQLIGAAVEHLFAGLVEDYHRAFEGAASARDRVEAAVRLLWERFEEPRLRAAFELYTAARTDPELRAALGPVLERHRANLLRAAAALFPEAARRNPSFDDAVDVVLAAMQGLAIGALAQPDAASEARQIDFLVRLARRELGG